MAEDEGIWSLRAIQLIMLCQGFIAVFYILYIIRMIAERVLRAVGAGDKLEDTVSMVEASEEAPLLPSHLKMS